MTVLTVRDYQTRRPTQSWRITSCRLSALAASIYG